MIKTARWDSDEYSFEVGPIALTQTLHPGEDARQQCAHHCKIAFMYFALQNGTILRTINQICHPQFINLPLILGLHVLITD